MRRKIVLLIAFAAAVSLIAVLGGSLGTHNARATSWYDQLPPIQKRILSGYAYLEVGPGAQQGGPQLSSGGDEEGDGGDTGNVTTNPLAKRITCAGNYGDNLKVNQNCLNVADP